MTDESRPTVRGKSPAEGPGARYVEIEAILRGEINAGTPPVGMRLPTEHELCARFNASRFTVRQALAGLREEGLVEARAGVGTIVVASRKREAFVQKLTSIEELLQYPSETYRRAIRIDPITASPELALLLKCKVGQPWVRLKAIRLTRAAQAPIAYFDIYVLPRYAGVLALPNPEGTPVVRQIEEALGVRAAHAQIEIFVGHITAELAEPLMALQDDPALIIIRRYRGPDGGVFLVTYSVHPENRFSLSIELERH
jgi:GntR family transcriptional regulator